MEVLRSVKNEGLSEYEKKIKKNREERLAFLKSLRINEAKAEFAEVVKSVRSQRKIVKSVKKSMPPILRKSVRLASYNTNLSEKALFRKSLMQSRLGSPSEVSRKSGRLAKFDIDFSKEQFTKHDRKVLPPVLSFEDAFKGAESLEDVNNDLNCLSFKNMTAKAKYYDKYVSRFKCMKLDSSNVARVMTARITAVDVHPILEKTVVCAAGGKGHIAFWNVGTVSNSYSFKCHEHLISKVQFNPAYPGQLISSSYDGTLRCGDIESKTFNRIYKANVETECTYFNVLSSNEFLVSQKNGHVALADVRNDSETAVMDHKCHRGTIKTVSIHPVHKSYFITADNKGIISLWDLRKLHKHPITDILHHEKSVFSAFFSPVTGNTILSLSADETICTFDSSNLDASIGLKRSLSHKNCIALDISIFHAVWLPHSEESFVVGSLLHPRRIEIYNDEMDNIYNFHDYENLTTITSVTAFHPHKSVLAGGSFNGKVLAFMDQQNIT